MEPGVLKLPGLFLLLERGVFTAGGNCFPRIFEFELLCVKLIASKLEKAIFFP